MGGHSQSEPEYKVSECGHVFRKACLYSHLTEPLEPNASDCKKCEGVKTCVQTQDWDALDVEAAIERPRKVITSQ
jgi:hypothetical protein